MIDCNRPINLLSTHPECDRHGASRYTLCRAPDDRPFSRVLYLEGTDRVGGIVVCRVLVLCKRRIACRHASCPCMHGAKSKFDYSTGWNAAWRAMVVRDTVWVYALERNSEALVSARSTETPNIGLSPRAMGCGAAGYKDGFPSLR